VAWSAAVCVVTRGWRTDTTAGAWLTPAISGPRTLASPDVYIDVQNAASMLLRLQRLGVEVGNRWDELADKAEARIGDCVSAFTLPHCQS